MTKTGPKGSDKGRRRSRREAPSPAAPTTVSMERTRRLYLAGVVSALGITFFDHTALGRRLPQAGVVELPFEMLPGLAVAHATHGRQFRAEPVACAQTAQLLDQTGRQHGVEALGDAPVQQRAIGGRQGDHVQAAGQGGVLASGVALGQWPATGAHDLECALDALGIGGLEARRRGRIEAGQLGMLSRPAGTRRGFVDARPLGRVGGGQLGQALAQGPEVEHGSADQQGDAAARGDRRHGV